MLQIQPELVLSTRLQVSVYGSVCVCMLLSLSTKEFSFQLHFHMLNYLIHQTSYPSLASAVCRGGCSEWL